MKRSKLEEMEGKKEKRARKRKGKRAQNGEGKIAQKRDGKRVGRGKGRELGRGITGARRERNVARFREAKQWGSRISTKFSKLSDPSTIRGP